MGATKTIQYSNSTLELAKIANALGHPARITIIELLGENPQLRMIDFTSILTLSWPTVYDHFKKLESAKIISYSFTPNEYQVHLKIKKLQDLGYFLDK